MEESKGGITNLQEDNNRILEERQNIDYFRAKEAGLSCSNKNFVQGSYKSHESRMRAELEPIHARITQLEISQRDRTTRVEPQGEQEAETGVNNVQQEPQPNARRNDQRGREPLDDDLSNIEVRVP
ncbi:hypothetical protein V6N13_024994 [Hibiscus sabdariffa]